MKSLSLVFNDVAVNNIDRTVNPAIAAVNAQVVIFGDAPLAIRVEIIIILSAFVLGKNNAFGLSGIYAVDTNRSFLSEIQIRVDKNLYQIKHIA